MKQYFSDSNDQQILTIFKAKVNRERCDMWTNPSHTPHPTTTSMVTVKYKVLNLLLYWFCTEKLIQWYSTLNTLICV